MTDPNLHSSGTAAPIVSVIMPVYNAHRYLRRTIDSILNQTFTDFEFIIIDDGSTDGSTAMLVEYAAADPRIRLVSRPNTGYVVALNEAIGLAQGQYLARMDADDIAMPDRFEQQARFLDEHPDYVCIGAVCAFIDEEDRFLRLSLSVFGDQTNQLEAMKGATTLIHPTWMMRRDAVMKVGVYDPSLMPAEDTDLLLRLGEIGKIDNLPQPLLRYRIHDNSVSSRKHQQQLECIRKAVERAVQRRGLPMPDLNIREFRAVDNRGSRCKMKLTCGWWAFQSGERRTAILYGLKALWIMPWSIGAWDLLKCALIKPMPLAAGRKEAAR